MQSILSLQMDNSDQRLDKLEKMTEPMEKVPKTVKKHGEQLKEM